jgi:ABC-2 type transport system permease protein
MDVILWGSLGVFVSQDNQASRAAIPYLLSGIILFWTLTGVQLTMATGVMEETWSRNLLNVLTTSVTPAEYLAGVGVFGLAKLALSMGTLTVTAALIYGFSLTAIGWSVIPIIALLVLNGWAIAFLVIGLILRFGQSAEILTWGINYAVFTMSGVFFPIEALPSLLRPVANIVPTTHAFAAVREVLGGRPVPWESLAVSSVETALFLAASLTFAGFMLRVFRARGFVTRYS